MALPVTDTFTGSDGTALTTYSTAWSNITGVFQINTNAVRSNSSGADTAARRNDETFPNDQYSQIVLVAVAAGIFIGPMVRGASGANTWYGHQCDNTGTQYLVRYLAGSYSELATETRTQSVNDVMRLEVSGTSVTAKINGTNRFGGPVTNSDISSGYAGICGFSSLGATRGDSFEAGALSTSYNESGAGIAGGVATGKDTKSATDSGAGIAGGVAAGADARAATDSGAGIAGGFASGAHTFAVTESGAGIAGGVGAGAYAFAVTESGAGIAGGVASGSDIISAFETGAAIIGAIASGLDAQAQSESGYGLAGAIASGAEQFTGGGGTVYNESGAGVAGAEASVADLLTLLESGYSVAGTIAAGADALLFADGGAAVVGGVVAGADVLGLSDGGAGLLGAIASGADWLVMYDSGYGLANAVASGAELTATGGEAARVDYVRERGQAVDSDEASARATGATVAQAQYSVRARGSKVQ